MKRVISWNNITWAERRQRQSRVSVYFQDFPFGRTNQETDLAWNKWPAAHHD